MVDRNHSARNLAQKRLRVRFLAPGDSPNRPNHWGTAGIVLANGGISWISCYDWGFVSFTSMVCQVFARDPPPVFKDGWLGNDLTV